MITHTIVQKNKITSSVPLTITPTHTSKASSMNTNVTIKRSCTHTHMHTHARTHAHTHPRTHTHSHTHTHTHTQRFATEALLLVTLSDKRVTKSLHFMPSQCESLHNHAVLVRYKEGISGHFIHNTPSAITVACL